MQVRAKKSLGQHFLTDLSIAEKIACSLRPDNAGAENPADVLEIGPGMGVLSQFLMKRDDIRMKMVEIDRESVDYLLVNFPQSSGSVILADFLKIDPGRFFCGDFCNIFCFIFLCLNLERLFRICLS